MRLILFLFILCSSMLLLAQKKKEIIKLKLKSSIVSELRNGKEILGDKMYYDEFGLLKEAVLYNDTGLFECIKKYTYNAWREMASEQRLDEKNKLMEMKIYVYNPIHQKIQENEFDSNLKLIKKSIFIYSKNGLKSEKKIYDSKNKLVATKKYQYTYYK